MRETQVQSLGGEDPLEKEMATHSSILAGKSHGQRRLVAYSPCGHKESDNTEQLNNNNNPENTPGLESWLCKQLLDLLSSTSQNHWSLLRRTQKPSQEKGGLSQTYSWEKGNRYCLSSNVHPFQTPHLFLKLGRNQPLVPTPRFSVLCLFCCPRS